MSNTHRGPVIIVAAVIFGAIADTLLRASPWGINVFLTVLAFGITIVLGAKRAQIKLSGGGRFFIIPALLFGGLFAVRDNGWMNFYNGIALLCALGMVAARGAAGRVLVANIRDYLAGLFSAVGAAIGGALVLLARHIPYRDTVANNRSSVAGRIIAGLVLSSPLVILFTVLFASADGAFFQLIKELLDPETLILRTILTLFWAWLMAGALWLLLIVSPERAGVTSDTTQTAATRGVLGAVESVTVLVVLNLLFGLFVFTQLDHFFGGEAHVLNIANEYTFAQYARRGFFELVIVAALVLGALLFLHKLTRRETANSERAFGVSASVLIGLTFAIIASALLRMVNYVRYYGLSEYRLHASTFMVWIGIVLLIFVFTMLRNRDQYFSFWSGISACGVLFALNMINPVALVITSNLQRQDLPVTQESQRFSRTIDMAYVRDLVHVNAEAVPVVMASFESLETGEKCVAAGSLLTHYEQRIAGVEASGDWRAFNLSRLQARQWLTPEWRSYYEDFLGANCGMSADGQRFRSDAPRTFDK
jgi:hypothetical protein